MTTTTDVSGTLAELRKIIDEREALAAQDSTLSKRKTELEAELLAHHESTGLDQMAGAGISISFNDAALRCGYDPDRWPQIVKWAVETGNDFIIQRRLTDSRILSLVEQGVALPEGLKIESYTKLNIRRK